MHRFNYDIKRLAARQGFEPQLTASKAAVLPLDDRAISRLYHSFSIRTARRRGRHCCRPLSEGVPLTLHHDRPELQTVLCSMNCLVSACGDDHVSQLPVHVLHRHTHEPATTGMEHR